MMRLRLGLTALLMLAVAGCGLLARPGGGRASACPTATADTQLLKNEASGYCLLHPADYRSDQPRPDEIVLFTGSLQNVEAGRATIRVSDAGGQAAPGIAGSITRDIAASLPGWGVRQSTRTIDGATAIVLDNVPGQDISRQVVMVRDGQLYLLTFVPADPAQTGAYQEMERLYETVVESFRFTR
jgi:hypothetical protein